MAVLRLDGAVVMKILERGNDVWIKRTKAGIVVLEVSVSKRQEIESS
ncbi:hypothetical protein SAMN02745823_02536 [Sporobacter termitidis DSM 10068]|uniref:Uncharacterized protein n=1 Tax=Sporobacter termitidis DSM 10068 TaxID=1123282 RepID=A0A1M5YHN9_9FIRM|nr:hypothetical protein [Sporobacter termitidis]SHI11408.1 hypothetical protein SAMN02745823_02536 [Sporobacter termitidis DSM 10068]